MVDPVPRGASDFQRRKRRAHTSLLSFFSADPCIIFLHKPGPGSDECTCESEQVPGRSIWLGFPCFHASYLPPSAPCSRFTRVCHFFSKTTTPIPT